MDNLLERFLKKIKVKDIAAFEGASFTSLIDEKESNRVSANILLDHYLPYDAYMDLFDSISEFTALGGFGIHLTFSYNDERTYFPRLLEEFKEKIDAKHLDDVYFYDTENKVLFYYENASQGSLLKEEVTRFNDFLDSISSSYVILMQEKIYMNDDFSKKRDESYRKVAIDTAKSLKQIEEINSTYQPCKLKDIENFPMVIVSGTIFKFEDRTTKKQKLIRSIEFYDGSDSVKVSLFEGKRMTAEDIMKYKEGVKVKIYGKPYHDTYSRNEITIEVDKIEIVDNDPLREDTAEEKRVELHLHTKFSALDGLATFEDYAKTAKRWGHKAIAVTDHGVCQAFPKAQKAGKTFGIKVLYGSELYMVDDTPKYIYNPDPTRVLSKSEFVVFDLETTGLSARYDRIIEFGAVKVDSTGQVIDEIDFFVNPDRKLSRFSLEESHITQEQVDHGKPIKVALKIIKEFIKDSILVAHNAAFDYGFLNEALKNNGLEPITNPVIDTLPISVYLYPNKKRHTEGVIARELDIQFDEVSAHRANYDALILSKILMVFIASLTKNKKDLTHADLGSLPITDEMILSMHPYHINVYVKNTAGLKDLYKVISDSQLNYVSSNGYPLIPKSHLLKYHDNLLFGSACFNGEVFEAAMTKSSDVLKETMKMYDFIEVQPPENYLYLINKGQLTEEDVKKIIKDLISDALSIGKLVCATGDCHYLNPEDKIFRDVYISARGLKGVRHPLNLAPYDSASDEVKKAYYRNPYKNPDQHFRTTDEMLKCFSFLNDEKLVKDIVIKNTNLVADMIADDIKPVKDKLYPPKIEGNEKLLSDLVYKTAKETYGDPLPKEIQERLDTELHGIIDNGYSVIYWISSLLVRWSNEQGYMIGSRGSVGSSLVATMSGITEVNPLAPHYICPKCHHLEWEDPNIYGSGYDLPEKECPVCHQKMKREGQNIPFATFLGFNAEKVPDIDLNFPSDFQSTAQEHIKELLGKDNVFKAGTIQAAKEKNALGYVKGYFESLGIDPSKIRQAELDRLAVGCSDVKRTTGQHPGGVIVIPNDMEVYDFTPVQYPADEVDSTWKTTHYDFKAIHDTVLKFDMLGHVDPQAVKMMCDLIHISFKEVLEKIPLNDPEALSLFWSPDALHLKRNVLKQETGALGLPEFGTTIGRRTLLETKPHCYSDLVRISGLSHGTDVYAGNARDLILENHMTLRDVIACRDDIMITLHDKYGMEFTDTFKIMELVRKGNFCKPDFKEQREKYTKLMQEHHVPDYYIHSCEKIKYLFPRGHAVAYVNMAMRCAYFKVHHPLEYYATYFTLRCDAYEIETMCKGLEACVNRLNDINTRQAEHRPVSNKELGLVNALEQTIEMYDRGYEFTHVDVNKSLSTAFSIDEKTKKIIPSFSSIDGLGSAVGDQIVSARKRQPFTSVEDFKERGKVSDKLIQVLRKLGALNGLPESDQMTLF